MDILTIISIIVTSISIVVGVKIFKIGKKKRRDKERRSYLCQIKQDFKFIRFGPIENLGIQCLPIEDVYIEPKVEYTPPGILIRPKTPKEDYQTAFENLYKEYRRQEKPLKIIIKGPSGSGKTILLKWIAYKASISDRHFYRRFVPIFISLKDLGKDPDNTYRKHNIKTLTGEHLNAMALNPSFFEYDFEKNGVIFLFDGLDEVPKENIRGEIMEWINRQNINGNPLLITTRESGINGVMIPTPLPVYKLKEFDNEDILRLLDKWGNNIEIEIVRDKRPEQKIYEDTVTLKIKIENKLKHLKEIFITNEPLRHLAKNPLLLTIIAVLQINKDKLKWPVEQHELYEECLKLVIELKYQNNSHAQPHDIEEKVKHCIKYLSEIAFFLVKNNRSEIEQKEIKEILPDNENQVNSCINDMVITGLLYKSNGKYGFLHITFQEYLAARYFAREKQPNHILEYMNNDYRPEIFKMYANLADQSDLQEFFNTIIENLEKNEYWKQLSLWEDCLLNIPDKNPQNENTKYKIEIQFAKHVLNLLNHLPYKIENEELIISLYPNYPLYLYACQFIAEAWELFNNAKHPFTQSIASTILHSCDKNPQGDLAKAKLTKAELLKQLKNRIDDFEKQKDKTPQAYIDFILQNSNTFPLIFASRKNILDFNYGLEKLKSGELFFNFLILHTLQSIVGTLSAGEVLKLLNLSDLRETLEFLEVRRFLRQIDLPLDIDLLALRDFLKLDGFMKLRIDMGDIRIFIEHKYFDKLRGMVDEYENQYWSRLKELKKEINTWVDLTTAKLHKLTDQEIMDYFPGTTEEDIKEFRAKTK